MSAPPAAPAPLETKDEEKAADPTLAKAPSLSFSRETWKRFKRRPRALMALGLLGFLFVVGFLAPLIVGTKPIVCKYKGKIYFPCLGYYQARWENPIFSMDSFFENYPANLIKKDPSSWAVWPLFYADPYKMTKESHWTIEPTEEEEEKGVKPRIVPGFELAVESDIDKPPSKAFFFGTDEIGRSVFARMVHGTQTALLVGFVSMSIAAAIGLTLGSIAGYAGGWVDLLLSRFIEIVQSIPSLILILALISVVKEVTIWKQMAVIGCTGWVGIARLTRAEFLKLKSLDWVTAAKALGFSPMRIIVRHILPNALAPALVTISFGIAGAILTESSLSFLGFGQLGVPSWGAVLQSGYKNVTTQWWLIVFPGLAIFTAVFTYNLLGDEYQQAIDPRLR